MKSLAASQIQPPTFERGPVCPPRSVARPGPSRHARGPADEGEIRAELERLSHEQAGMTGELLCVYEQLGVVFEVTRRLAEIRDESQALDLFVDSLRKSFSTREVFAFRPDAPRREPSGGNPSYLFSLVHQARRQRTVVVDRPSSGSVHPPAAEIMVAPVFSGEELVCAIILTRQEDAEPFQASDMLLLESLTRFCGDLIRATRLVRELREMSVSIVRSLVSAVDQKDEYTSGHSVRVAYYADQLGAALGIGDEERDMLRWSALLHDVGKIGIRDDVLKKTGRLEPEEFSHIQEHPRRSYQVVCQVPQLAGALDGVLHHHERYDGKGYPAGLAGEAIPLQARIIQIADIFDALTSQRSYRPAYTWERAMDILAEEAGRAVDPELQKAFDGLMRRALRGGNRAWEEMTRRANRFVPETREGMNGGE